MTLVDREFDPAFGLDVGRGLFRILWACMALLGIGIALGAASLILSA